MSIKEAPLIRAVSHYGPLPGFLFTNPILNGFIPVILSTITLACVAFFLGMEVHVPNSQLNGAVNGIRVAAIIGLILSVPFLMIAFIRGLIIGDDRVFYSLFGFGIVLAIAFLFFLDWLFLPTINGWASDHQLTFF
ncbi:hypothetical protein FF098_015535 [Parvularcula flava]|uniref:Uncharacterized protein n=1 Tax=Aquisalinus luteolus TaxID=1566827 RepID=A0A8J3EQ69_9PROT|nr:hypothetical protein [Aquisalinus luteolus]NHK29329.1 hypothetical protein [Aquisalinus luteolus]GGI01110.1 hypothetical protein GCM10011355_30980 [Aquisalinus luteolus]